MQDNIVCVHCEPSINLPYVKPPCISQQWRLWLEVRLLPLIDGTEYAPVKETSKNQDLVQFTNTNTGQPN